MEDIVYHDWRCWSTGGPRLQRGILGGESANLPGDGGILGAPGGRTVKRALVLSSRANVIDGYFDHYGYFDHSETLNFTISPRRRQRRRRQYEVIQKMLNETSLDITKIYSLIISVQNKQSSGIFRILSFSTHFDPQGTLQNFIYS
jgi:hypothetical protein